MLRSTRPTYAEIRLSSIRSNLRSIQRRVGRGVDVMAVVKANAYGHGLLPVSLDLQENGTPAFGVAFAEEGSALRAGGIRKPVQVFALSNGPQAELCVRHRLEPTVATVESIRTLQRAASASRRTIDVHLKVDTGMNRIGVRPEALASVLRELGRSSRIRLKGVYTHFATADVPGSPFLRQQLTRFHRSLEVVIASGAEPELVHAANSGAILQRPDAVFSMVRAGILMYGCSPFGPTDRTIEVQQALRWVTSVAQVKWIGAGETVSYGRRFRARRPTTIATIPVGYADGLFRTLTNRLDVLIHGRRRPVVGTICMDQCMVDCGRMDVAPGDEVTVIGTQGSETITAWEIARRAGTIPYEVVCAVSARVPRVYRP